MNKKSKKTLTAIGGSLLAMNTVGGVLISTQNISKAKALDGEMTETHMEAHSSVISGDPSHAHSEVLSGHTSVDVSKETKLVEKAEQSKSKEDIQAAKEAVEKILDKGSKEKLLQRISSIQEKEVKKEEKHALTEEEKSKIIEELKTNANKFATSAESSKDIKDIAKARDYVNKMPEGKEKEELQTKLNNIEIKGFDESTKSNVTGDMDVVVESNPTIEMTLSTNLLNIKDYNGLEDIEISNAFSITVSSGLSFNLNVQALGDLKNDKGNTIPIEHMTLKAHDGNTVTVSKDKKETLVTNHKHGKDIKFDFDVKLKADSSIVPDIYKTTLKFEATQK